MNTDLERRDWFAALCPQEEIKARIPNTCGGTRDALVALGIVPRDTDVLGYKEKHVALLRAIVRYQYADEMIKASQYKMPPLD